MVRFGSSMSAGSIWAACASSLALVIATPALAQTSEPPVANAQAGGQADAAATVTTEAPSDRLGDVIVTARRTSERLQDIPASVAAVTGDQVTRMNSLADIQSLVSGVTFRAIGPIPAVGIRGYGNRPTAVSRRIPRSGFSRTASSSRRRW